MLVPSVSGLDVGQVVRNALVCTSQYPEIAATPGAYVTAKSRGAKGIALKQGSFVRDAL
jgi:hypothetical protein